MRLTLLGTGCPIVSTDRYGPAQVVSHGGRVVLIDCGSGVTQRLAATGLTGRDIDAVLLTHLHSDHLVDLFQLVVTSWHQGRDRPQRVIGPPGTRAFVDGLMALWRPELDQRIAHELRPSTAALDIEVEEIDPGDAPEAVLDVDGLSIAAFRVDHRPVRHAFGFVCAAAGARLVISGDTRRCAALIEAALGADLLLHEVFIHRDMPPPIEGGGARPRAWPTWRATTPCRPRSARLPPKRMWLPSCSATSCRRPATATRCWPRSPPTSRAR